MGLIEQRAVSSPAEDGTAFMERALRQRLERLQQRQDALGALDVALRDCQQPAEAVDRLWDVLARHLRADAVLLLGPQPHGEAAQHLPAPTVAIAGRASASILWDYTVPALQRALAGQATILFDTASGAPGRPLPLCGMAPCRSAMTLGLPGTAAQRSAVVLLAAARGAFGPDDLAFVQALLPALAQRLEALAEQVAWRGLLRAQSRTMAASEARFRDHALAAADFLWEYDEHMRLRYEAADVTPSGAVRFNLTEGPLDVPTADSEAVAQQLLELEDVRLHRPFRDATVQVAMPGGENMHWLSFSGRPVHDDSGRFTGYRGIARDVTAQVEAQQQAEAQRFAAEEAVRLRSNFLAVIGHELRTPVAALIGTLTLQQEAATEESRLGLGTIALRNAEEMLVLLTDLLDMSRMEAGRLPLQAMPFELGELVDSTLDMVDAQARAKGLALRRTLPQAGPCYLRGDAGRLRQMLLNFLSNAIKFTASGSVTLHVTAAAPGTRGHDCMALRFAVEDTGRGLSEEEQGHLFLPFNQLGAMESRSMGTGLGLAITRRLAEMMDGSVGVESRLGRGSIFWFEATLPVADAREFDNASAAEEQVDAPVRACNVLLVEDNPTNCMIGQTMLTALGAQVTIATTGRRALALAADSRFDLVLMDIGLPEMDGVAATRAIRDLGGHNADLPILALTANTREEDAQTYLESGFTAVMTKPLRRPQLMAALQRHAGSCSFS